VNTRGHPNSAIVEYERKRALLISALVEGERSGPSIAFDFDAFIAAKRAEAAA